MADDLAQGTFLKAYERWDGLRDKEAARAWLFQIAYRGFVDHYRKETRRKDLAEGHFEEAPPEAPAGLKMDIEAAMNSLPPECRAVVILCLAHGMSHSEVAATTDLPLGTVKSYVTRGKARLRTFLSAYEQVN